jgi:hypothetical protein
MHIIKIAVVEPTIMISRIIKLIMARPKDAELSPRELAWVNRVCKTQWDYIIIQI